MATADELSVFMDVVCFHNGKHNAMSGYRLHFVPASYPPVMVVGLPGRQTINRAHLQALIKAIQTTAHLPHRGIVLQTRSEILVCLLL